MKRIEERFEVVDYLLDNELFDVVVDEEEHLMSFYVKDSTAIFCVFDLEVIDDYKKSID